MGCFPQKTVRQQHILQTPTSKGKSGENDQTQEMIQPPMLSKKYTL